LSCDYEESEGSLELRRKNSSRAFAWAVDDLENKGHKKLLLRMVASPLIERIGVDLRGTLTMDPISIIS
jgi:hypothetical protein